MHTNNRRRRRRETTQTKKEAGRGGGDKQGSRRGSTIQFPMFVSLSRADASAGSLGNLQQATELEAAAALHETAQQSTENSSQSNSIRVCRSA
jgi:hypothetical protein